ncbi:MAG: RHH-type proline utilization regulon transcriptional repressor/proline dehydrogenase [Chlamydiales bacterium]|jgi:RHH-type proline utilization regulon transcriptional repressor/proline dehydrogenase/delta 1-pyrroline-5-carboxylate dehydrogenase
MGSFSQRMQKAKQRLEVIKGKKLSVKERCGASIELASLMLEEAQSIQNPREKAIQDMLSRMMKDPDGKAFTNSFTDQCFRSERSDRVANQLVYLIESFGVPKFLPFWDRVKLSLFKLMGRGMSRFLVPLVSYVLRKETSDVIIPGERKLLNKHMLRRFNEGVRVNLNHLGEAILGEGEAQRRLQLYLDDLAKPEIEYVSVKISTICSQLNLLAWDETLEGMAERLRTLYREAMKYEFTYPDGRRAPKFVNLDMEEYRDLHLTVAIFKKILDEEEFRQHSAGIVLQAYLPDSYLMQQELTAWSIRRLAKGGAPIKIRVVKGANLAMEQVEASLNGWAQAPYENKVDVDANYKRMLLYGFEPKRAKAVHIGVGSHNLFDIAFALLLRSEKNVEQEVEFEMLEGMADHMREVVQELSGGMLLYCPVARKHEFQNAVAYLIRRLDENTGEENFLGQSFGMHMGSEAWKSQVEKFEKSCEIVKTVSYVPRRSQNRLEGIGNMSISTPFDNDATTDWSLKKNREWAQGLLSKWSVREHPPAVPLVISGGTVCPHEAKGIGQDPSRPGHILYNYYLADESHVEKALESSVEARNSWSEISVSERSEIGFAIAQGLRRHRGELIGVMVADAGKVIPEADSEVSEAIDFVEYYRRSMEEVQACEDLELTAKGTVLVTPPWNFPCAIPVGGIFAALMTGNTVIFKPAPETVLVGWHVAQVFWAAGVPKDVLQFINCLDEPVGSKLIADPRVSCVILTGATDTAKLFWRLRPELDLVAETGGKNAIIVTEMADRDLAVKDIVHSAFGHAGQKCSAASLLVCESEVYDSPDFRRQLRDAAASLKVGSAWELSTEVNPLIHEPNDTLQKGLTTLEAGEEWLLEPKQSPVNPQLWSPGIKFGVKKGSASHQKEFFGPLLSVMRSEDLDEAIDIVNGTPYGLTSGLHSLDEREHEIWLDKIEAGNCYINRGITGAIVRRQPFGGCKESCFGFGTKPGGPNYLIQFLHLAQKGLPTERAILTEGPMDFYEMISQQSFSHQEKGLWQASIGSYAFWWHYYKLDHDYSRLVGQDNVIRYLPRKAICLRLQKGDSFLSFVQVCAAIVCCKAKVEISASKEVMGEFCDDNIKRFPGFSFAEEDELTLIDRLRSGEIKRLRVLSTVSEALVRAVAETGCYLARQPVLANGRVELLQYLSEVSISKDYHRYGNLGTREQEKRRPLPRPITQTNLSVRRVKVS